MKKLKLSLITAIFGTILVGCASSDSQNVTVSEYNNKNINQQQQMIIVSSDFDGYSQSKNGILDYSRKLFFLENEETMEITGYDPTLSTEFYIEQVSSHKIIKLANKNGQLELPEGKYRVHGIGGYFRGNNNSRHANGEYFVTNQNGLFLSSLPTDDSNKLEFEIKSGSTTHLNQIQNVRKVIQSGFFASAEFVSISGFKIDITNDFSNQDYYFEYGFDKSVNMDYIKIGKKEPKIYYVASMSADLAYYNSDKSREIYNMKAGMVNQFAQEMTQKHIIEQNYFFEKYLTVIPSDHIK